MTYRFTTLPLAAVLAEPLVFLAPWPTAGADAALMVFNLLAIDLCVGIRRSGDRRGRLVVLVLVGR